LRLNCGLHFQINKATGWLDRPTMSGPSLAEAIWNGAERVPDASRRYQTRIRQGERTWWAFAPSSPDGINHYMENYFARINAAGWYPRERFPFGVDFSGVDFYGASMRGLAFSEVRLANAELNSSLFEECVFTAILAQETRWNGAKVAFGSQRSAFAGAQLAAADFENCVLFDVFGRDEVIPPHFAGAIVTLGGGNPRRIRSRPMNESG
jgi:hypothetical protein